MIKKDNFNRKQNLTTIFSFQNFKNYSIEVCEFSLTLMLTVPLILNISVYSTIYTPNYLFYKSHELRHVISLTLQFIRDIFQSFKILEFPYFLLMVNKFKNCSQSHLFFVWF